MPMRIVDINTDISSTYADVLGKMKTVELTRGTPLTRGASLAYQLAVRDLVTEVHYGPRDSLEWPCRRAHVAMLLIDIEAEYLKDYQEADDDMNVRFVLDDAACSLGELVDLITNVEAEK